MRITDNLLKRIIKPLMPKLVGYMNESDELNDGEIKKSIMLNVINNDFRIYIVTLKEDSGKLIISRILKTIGGDDLLNGD